MSGLIFNGNGDVIRAVDGSLTIEGLDLGGGTNVNAGIGTFSDLNVTGTLTYEDVKNVDSVGIISARQSIHVGYGVSAVGIITGTSFDGNLNASQLASGTVPTARLGSGTANNSVFLRGDSSWAAVTQTTINSNTNNYLITGTGTANTLQGEANLTYDGTNLQLKTDANNEGIILNSTLSGGSSYPVCVMEANRSAGNTLGKLISKWNGTEVASIQFVSGSDSTNKDDAHIYFNTASAGTATNRLIITSAGQVQVVGTASNDPLLVKGGTGANASIRLEGGASSNDNSRIESKYNLAFAVNGDGNQSGRAFHWYNSTTELMSIDSSGRLLIGTTSTGFGSYGDALTIYKASHVGITLRTATDKDAAIYFADSASGNGRYAGFIDYSHGSNYLRFGTNETERLRIDSSGRLGLKTSAMSSYNGSADDLVLDNGANDLGITLDSESQCSIAFTDSAKTGWDGWIKYVHSNNHLQFGAGAAERLRIASDGKLFVGATAAVGAESWLFRNDAAGGADGCRLTVYNASNNSVNNQARLSLRTAHSETTFSSYNQGEIYIANPNAAAYFVTYLGGTERLRITNAGRVGINESSPDNQLHVKTTTDTEQIKVENSASSGRAQIKFTSPHAEWVAGTLGGSTTGDFITYTANEKNARWYTNNFERLRLTSGGQLVQFTNHTTGASAHQNTSWYGDDANHYNIEVRDFNEMYALKTNNANNYSSIVYKREKMTNYCDIEFTMSGQSSQSGSGYYHFGLMINSDGSDTFSNFDLLVLRSNGGNTALNQIRLDKGGGGEGFNYTSNNLVTFFDGNERHYQIKIRGRRFSIYIDGSHVLTRYTDANLVRTHGFPGLSIYEASTVNPWIKVRDFKVTNHTPNTGVPSWETVFDTPASTNASSSFVIDNMDNPQTVEMRFWRLRHSGGNTNTYFRLGWQGSYKSSGYYDIAQYHNESGGWNASRGHNQAQGQPFHYAFTASTNYYSGVMTIRRVTSGGNNTGFVYNSNVVVDYDSGNTQYHIINNGQVNFGNTNPWTKIQLYTNSGTNFNYGSMQVLAQY